MSQQHRCRVIVEHEALYADPITIDEGETVQVSEKIDTWHGNSQWIWVWCTDQRGKSGWVPRSIIHLHADGKTGSILSPYSAIELSVAVGDELLASHSVHGWLWCTNHQGMSGWVPLDNVSWLSANKDGIAQL